MKQLLFIFTLLFSVVTYAQEAKKSTAEKTVVTHQLKTNKKAKTGKSCCSGKASKDKKNCADKAKAEKKECAKKCDGKQEKKACNKKESARKKD